MAMPVAGTKLGPTLHLNLHNIHQNVKAFGCVGDGVADDTAGIQAAIDAAGATDGMGTVLIPRGDYKITSPLSLDTPESVVVRGALGNNPDPSPGVWHKSGTRISGNFNDALFEKTGSGGGNETRIEDLGLHNNHATGMGVVLNEIEAPAGVFNCFITSYIGIQASTDIFNASIWNCTFQHVGTIANAGSRGIDGGGFIIFSVDINGYERGINAPTGIALSGSRIEACGTGVYMGGGGFTGGGSIVGIGMEANDVGIYAKAAAGVIASVGINGHSGSPAGGSQVAVKVDECSGLTFINIAESGTHLTKFVQTNGPVSPHSPLTFIGCKGTSGWSLFYVDGVSVINCEGQANITRAPVTATADLYAAGANQDGMLVIEDAGAGNRNLIIYGGGQRFRIDGGAAV